MKKLFDYIKKAMEKNSKSDTYDDAREILESITLDDEGKVYKDKELFKYRVRYRANLKYEIEIIEFLEKDKRNITKIEIPEKIDGYNVTSIGEKAFHGCESLTSVTIGSGVTSIGKNAFYYCKRLKRITIPDSVTDIDSGIFEGCTSLTEINVSNNNPVYCAIDGIVCNKDKTELIICPGGQTEVIIPDCVTSIGEKAFKDGKNLTSVTIGSGVTNIGKEAFYNCESLTSITIPDSVTEIGRGAFESCESLTSVTIGSGVTSIGEEAFYNCKSLISITIPDSVTSIGDCAFEGCTSLKSITIPDSVTEIGAYAFRYCTSLKSITIPDSVTEIGWGAFKGCTSLESITIGSGVKSIGGSAFGGCTSLKSITIPDSVTRIGENAFEACTSLKSITIPDSVISIGKYAFSNCENLESVIIKDKIESIDDTAFSDCFKLQNITVGKIAQKIKKRICAINLGGKRWKSSDGVTFTFEKTIYNNQEEAESFKTDWLNMFSPKELDCIGEKHISENFKKCAHPNVTLQELYFLFDARMQARPEEYIEPDRWDFKMTIELNEKKAWKNIAPENIECQITF